jgi:hypothetical protein
MLHRTLAGCICRRQQTCILCATTLINYIVVFWVLMQCSLISGYKYFGGTCFLPPLRRWKQCILQKLNQLMLPYYNTIVTYAMWFHSTEDLYESSCCENPSFIEKHGTSNLYVNDRRCRIIHTTEYL